MGNLHLAKERGSTSEHEFDLRGLGNDPLLHAYPFGALLIESANHAKFMRAARGQGFQAEMIRGNLLSIFPKRRMQGEHKIHSLHLFTFVLKTLDQFGEKDRVYLFEHNHFRFVLENAIKNQHTDLHEEFASQFSEVKWTAGKIFQIHHATSLHLAQAGFKIEATPLQDITFSLPQLSGFKDEARREHQKFSRERKVA